MEDLAVKMAAQKPWGKAAGLACSLLIAVLFFSFWWNRSLSPTVGGELLAMLPVREGLIPYRDFHVAAPPGIYWISQGIGAVFGPKLVYLWALGVLVRVAATGVLFWWLCDIAEPAVAAFSACTALVLSSVDIADTPFFYNHMAVAFVLGAGFLLARSLDRRTFLYAWLAGLLAGFSALIKHTVGVFSFMVLAAVLAILLVQGRNRKELAKALAGFAAGFLLMVCIAVVWVWAKGLLPPFMDQLFGRGPSSKGGLSASLMRPLTLTLAYPGLLLSALIGMLYGLLGCLGWRIPAGEFRSKGIEPWVPCMLLVAVVVAGFKLPWWPFGDFRELLLGFGYTILVGFPVWGVLLLARQGKGAHPDPSLLLLVALGFATAFSLAISWPVFEVMLFPGLAVPLALLLERTQGATIRRFVYPPVLLCCLLLAGLAGWRKSMYPDSWGRWAEPPIAYSQVPATLPPLRGFVLSRPTEQFYQVVAGLIMANSGPEDRLFVYPNMPIFYGLTGRLPATRALAHWIDTCPDYLAVQDAERLLRNPPKVMVIHPDRPDEFTYMENLFRGGHPSGLRTLLATVETLLPQYDRVGILPVPGSSRAVFVFVRKAVPAK